jgi:hypothetical protein
VPNVDVIFLISRIGLAVIFALGAAATLVVFSAAIARSLASGVSARAQSRSI